MLSVPAEALFGVVRQSIVCFITISVSNWSICDIIPFCLLHFPPNFFSCCFSAAPVGLLSSPPSVWLSFLFFYTILLLLLLLSILFRICLLVAPLSCLSSDLYKSLQSGSQVALPPHLQLAFSGKIWTLRPSVRPSTLKLKSLLHLLLPPCRPFSSFSSVRCAFFVSGLVPFCSLLVCSVCGCMPFFFFVAVVSRLVMSVWLFWRCVISLCADVSQSQGGDTKRKTLWFRLDVKRCPRRPTVKLQVGTRRYWGQLWSERRRAQLFTNNQLKFNFLNSIW